MTISRSCLSATAPSRRFVALVLAGLAAAGPVSAATSFAQVRLYDVATATEVSDEHTDSPIHALAGLPGVAGEAFSSLSTGSLGVGVSLDTGAPFGFYNAQANWYDAWTVTGGGQRVPMLSTISINGDISTAELGFSDGYWSLKFIYWIDGNWALTLTCSADSTPASCDAHDHLRDLDLGTSLVLGPNPANPLLTHFSLTYALPFTALSGSFSDSMEASIKVDAAGPLVLDATHTFRAEVAALDPNVVVMGDGGRLVSAVPEPGTYAMLLAGLAVLGRRVGRSRRGHD